MPKNVLFRKQVTPVGTIMAFSGGTVPEGWMLLCPETLQIADYPKLFEVIGNTYGGDGITTFKLPDYRGRIAVGKDDMGGTAAAGRITSGGAGIDGTILGDTGGSQTHTLSKAQIPLHGHPYRLSIDTIGNASGGLMTSTSNGNVSYFVAPEYVGTPSNNRFRSIGGTGSGQTHQNTQPSIICNYIIKVV